MKNIGNTTEGNYLVEMGQDELTEFRRLQEAVEGKTRQYEFFSHADISRHFEFDFTNVFHAIRAFYLAQFQINDFQQLIDDIRTKLNN
jgi:hypothetical protein